MTEEELRALANELAAASGGGGMDALAQELATASRQPPQPNPDGTYGQPPEGYVTNPYTGQMTSRAELSNNMAPNSLEAFALGGGQGASLGALDEAAGGVQAMVPGGGGYAFGREFTRAALDKAREDHPVAYYGGVIPGAAATTIAGWNAAGIPATGQSAMGTLGRGMGMGSVEGGVAGFAEGEGGLRDRIVNALLVGGLGTMTGGAAVPAAWVLNKGARAVGDIATGAFEGLTGRGNEGKAARALASTLERSGRSADDVATDVARAATEGQPEFRAMDAMGLAGARRASGIVRAGGDGAEELAQYLDRRGLDATDRMLTFTDEAFPASRTSEVAQRWTSEATKGRAPTTAAQATETLRTARSDTAGPLYEAASANARPVDVTPVLDEIDGLLRSDASIDGGVTGLSETALGKRLARIRNQVSTGDYQTMNFGDVLETKQELGRAIAAMRRRGDVPPQFSKVYRQLDSVLEDASDSYRAANDSYRQMSDVVDAVDEGGQMARRGRVDDTTTRFAQMTPDEQAAARAGYGDQVASELERNKAAAPDVARAFASTKRQGEAAAMAENPNLFLRRVGREGDMNRVMQRALGGSRTADNLQDVADLGPIASAGRAAASAAQGRAFDAAQNMLSAVTPYLTGTSEGTRTLIARALMSPNPRQALEAASRSMESSQQARAVAQALLRSMQRQPALAATR